MRRQWVWLVIAWVALDGWLVRWWMVERREHRAESHILAAARKYGVEPALVKAVVWRESRFRAEARGRVGELGLMQVGELAGDEWADAEDVVGHQHPDLLDPARNTRAGTWYLAKLLKRYPRTDNPAAYALADYNAGRANVLRWLKGEASTNSVAFLEAMDFPGTREYVRSILDRRDQYRGRFPRPGQ
jgi:soluble lytic murein transglycosylase